MLTLALLASLAIAPDAPDSLPGTALWDDRADSKAEALAMVEGLHRFLDRETAASVERRARHWDRDTSSAEAYAKSVAPNRERLARIVGAVDPRIAPPRMDLVATTEAPALIAEAESFRVYAVRWPVYDDVDAEGLLLEPKAEAVADVVAMADCDGRPSSTPGSPRASSRSRRSPDCWRRPAAGSSCRPCWIDRRRSRGTRKSG